MIGLRRRVMELFRRSRLDREAAEELAHHLELLVARKRASGLDEAAARREALLEIGAPDAAREAIAAARTGVVFEQVAREIRHGVRVLRRAPGLTLLSAATIGLGIGSSTVLFALVNGILLQPLPYPDPDRLVSIVDTNPQAGVERAGAASGNIQDWRRAASLDGVAGYFTMGRTLSSTDDAEVLMTAQVSQDFFPVLGVAPIAGRMFTEDESRRALFNNAAGPIGVDPVAIVSHGLWQRLGGGADVIGRVVTLDRQPFRIVGVMPEGFAMPGRGVQIWIAWNLIGDLPRDQHFLGAVGRLRTGASIQQAEADLNEVARGLALAHPETNRGWEVRLSTLRAATVGDTATVLWVLLAAVGLVLLTACANVALLSLLRAMNRATESAVRLALGATPVRLLRESLLESLLVALLGGGLGVAIAAAGLRGLSSVTVDLPRLDEVTLDYRALVFAAVLTTIATFVSGAPMAWRRARLSPAAGLSDATVRTTAGTRRHLLGDAIVVGQIAMAAMLLSGAGLLVRSVLHLRGVDPGFDPRGVIVAPVFLDMQAYSSGEHTRRYYRTLFDRLSALPGVVAVGGATTVPTSRLGPDFERPVWPAEVPDDRSSRTPASVRMITPGYFPALGLRLAGGRGFDNRDRPDSPKVAIVNERLARRLWPGQDAVGRRLAVDQSLAGTLLYEIVGVVRDMRFRGPRSEPAAEIYLPHAQRSYLVMNVVVKTAGDPLALMPAVRAVLKEVDPKKPAHGLYLLTDLIGATYARDRQAMMTLVVFAVTATLLAVMAVYGVLTNRVRERSREIGIRMAMGADAAAVVRWIAGRGLRLIALGLALGLAAARLAGGALTAILAGVTPTDTLTAVAVAASLAAVGLAATLLPARRATRIEPVAILREG